MIRYFPQAAIAAFLFAFAWALPAPAQQLLGGTNPSSTTPPPSSVGTVAQFYLDFASGRVWGPKDSSGWGSVPTSNIGSGSAFPSFSLPSLTNYHPSPGYSAYVASYNLSLLPPGDGINDYITINPNSFPDASIINFSWPLPYASFGVYAFNELIYGNYLGAPLDSFAPVRLSSITGLNLVSDISYSGTSALSPSRGLGFNIIIDLFTTSTAGSASTTVHEVDIALHSGDLNSKGCGSFGSLSYTYTDAQSRQWDVYTAALTPPILCVNSHTAYLDTTTGSFDLAAFFTSAISHSLLASTEWFNGVSVGVEPIRGGGSVPVTKFNWSFSAQGNPNAPAVNTDPPYIHGNPYFGSPLSCYPGKWTGTPVPILTYVWKRNGSTIGGATSPQYTTVAADVGATLTCTVTATNVLGPVTYLSPGVSVTAIPHGDMLSYDNFLAGQGPWASSAGVSWANDGMVYTSVAQFNSSFISAPIESSATYKVITNITSISAGGVEAVVGNTHSGNIHTTPGIFTDTVTVGASPAANVQLMANTVTATSAVIASMSVQKQ